MKGYFEDLIACVDLETNEAGASSVAPQRRAMDLTRVAQPGGSSARETDGGAPLYQSYYKTQVI
jgi:hypothetical protein